MLAIDSNPTGLPNLAPIASERPDMTAADFLVLAAVDATHHALLHGAGPWILGSNGEADIKWTEPWDHSRAYLSGRCYLCDEYPEFRDERPSHHPEASAWLAKHPH